MKQKRIVTIEFDRVKITTNCRRQGLTWCAICQAETEFISQTEFVGLVKIMQTQGLTVHRENLHFCQPGETQILVCLASIVNGNCPKIIK